MACANPSTTALLKLATPLQIAPEGILLTFKNERLVAQISDSNKKQLIAEAANILFNKDNIPVTIRLAQSGDKPVQPTTQVTQQVEEKSEPLQEPSSQIQQTEPLQNTSTNTTNNEDVSEDKKARLESDQEKMVLELFDGKYVE